MLPDISKAPGKLRANRLRRILVGWNVGLCGCLEGREGRQLRLMNRLRLLRGGEKDRRDGSLVTIVVPKCCLGVWVKFFYGTLRDRMVDCSGR